MEWCKSSDHGLLSPDITLFLDIDPLVAKERGGYGNEIYEKLEYQIKVRSAFHKLKTDDWKIINAENNIDQVESQIMELVKENLHLESCDLRDNLWIQ